MSTFVQPESAAEITHSGSVHNAQILALRPIETTSMYDLRHLKSMESAELYFGQTRIFSLRPFETVQLSSKEFLGEWCNATSHRAYQVEWLGLITMERLTH